MIIGQRKDEIPRTPDQHDPQRHERNADPSTRSAARIVLLS